MRVIGAREGQRFTVRGVSIRMARFRRALRLRFRLAAARAKPSTPVARLIGVEALLRLARVARDYVDASRISNRLRLSWIQSA